MLLLIPHQTKNITHEVDCKCAHKKTVGKKKQKTPAITFGYGYGFSYAFANMHAASCPTTHSAEDYYKIGVATLAFFQENTYLYSGLYAIPEMGLT